MMGKRILLGVAVALVALQLVRPQKSVSAQPPGGNDFVVRFSPPPELALALREACYDCHSNSTRYPWYAEVQPVGWWLANHVRQGKRELNLSDFGSYTARVQLKKLNEMSEQIADRKMPMPGYARLHPPARLSDAQVNALSEWLDNLHDRARPGE